MSDQQSAGLTQPNVLLMYSKDRQVDRGGGPPGDGGMDHERRITVIETLLPTLATKADMAEVRTDIHKMDASIKTWMVATIITIIGAMLAAIFGVSQIQRSTSPAAPMPIIIQAPQQPMPSPTPPPASPTK